MASRRNRRGDGADDRAFWNDGGAGPAFEHPIGAAAGEDATARIVPAAPGASASAALADVPIPGSPAPSGLSGTTDLVDAEALSDMQAFNDLKARRRKQRRKRVVVGVASAAAVIVLAGVAFAWYAADQAAKALESAAPQTGFVEQGTFVETVSASGSLQPVASVSATPAVDGIVGEVLVAEGDAVAAGQTLFTVVNDELDKAVKQAAQGIEEARNGVAQAQNAVNDAYHAKSAGKQAAAEAEAQAAAAAEAAAAAAASVAAGTAVADAGSGQAPVAQASFDEASADSAIRSAELALSSANLALQNAQSAYDEAVARAEKRTVTSSIAGSVVAVNIEPGKALATTAAGAASPVQIADLSQMTVSINVNEIDILKITAGQTAQVTFTAAPDLTLPADVVSIATTASGSGDSAAGAMYGGPGGAVTYAVKLLIAAPDPRLKPGMTAKATITTMTVENALMVPISAVQTDGAGGGFVTVVVDPETRATETRQVEVVASDGLTSVVKGQVKAGDEVVVSGGMMLEDGSAAGGAGMASPDTGGVAVG